MIIEAIFVPTIQRLVSPAFPTIFVRFKQKVCPVFDELMHDFSCTNADDMNFSLMAERTKYLKEDQEGVQEMSKILEDLRNETDLAARTEIARAFLLMEEFSYEKIAEGTKLPIEYIEELAGKDIF